MESDIEIDLIKLKEVVDRLFSHLLKSNESESLKLEDDNYWNIPYPEIYQADISKNNLNLLDIGSLQDDWEFLSPLLDDSHQPLVLQFINLSSLFRYIGETVGNELGKEGL